MMKKSSTIIKAASRASGVNVTYIKTISKQRTVKEVEIFKQEISTDDHIISLDQLKERYSTDLQNGLTREQAGELLRKNGPNCLIATVPRSKLSILREHLCGGFAGLLWVGALLAIISFVLSNARDKETPYDNLYLAFVLIAVVLCTGIFSYLQETSNAEIMDSFSKLIPKLANVIREGHMIEIPAEELVVGDLVGIAGGDCVPADVRILVCSGLKVDNSPITGESEYQTLSSKCTDANPLETENMAFFGTNVIEGAGEGIVVACGDSTLIGHIAGLATSIQPDILPIKRELNMFIKVITILAVCVGLLFFIISLSVGYSFFDSCIYFIAIVIANVPEGMLVTLTACLTLTAKRMSEKNCLVKNLQAIETLGSTNVICSDKTGTLTQNRMTVAHMFYDDYIVDTLNESNALERSRAFEYLCRVGILCNKAEFKPCNENLSVEKKEAVGNASEVAVMKIMEKLVGNVREIRAEMYKVCEIPFNSTKKYQLSIHFIKTENRYLIVMKGAPEVILEHCSTYFTNGNSLLLNETKLNELHKVVAKLGYMGERVLGFADFLLPEDQFPPKYEFNPDIINFPINNLRFVGLISMMDPPRPSVPYAVERCRNAGIRVIMVTGDHPITAISIARKVGIISPKNETIYDISMRQNVSILKVNEADAANCRASVITGASLREMSQYELDQVLNNYKEIVFARTSPQQKLKIVESLQRLENIVAVTGDGVNDSPALKRADIGVAMGISGSEVSKQAADIIILDDNFSSIVTGIEEGRLVFDNLKKSIAYVLTSNVPEIFPFVLFVTLNIPQILSVLSIVIIDVGTDLWPAISLAYENAEADIMSRKPRNPKVDKLVNSRIMGFTYLQIGVIQTCAGLTSYFIMMAEHGFFYDRLIGIREEWDSMEVNDLQDSYKIPWSYDERKYLERKGYSVYFMSIVITQIADGMIAKTRTLSLFQQGLTNWVFNFGIIFELFLTCCVVYIPGLNRALNFEALEWYAVLPAIPYAFLIIIYDEIRKYFIRKYPHGWVQQETYY